MIVQRNGSNDQPARREATLHVLCVDDEPGLAETVSASLEYVDEEIRATATESAEKALRGVREGRFDCVVSDYRMPRHDGAWLCEQVTSHDSDIPFILYTSCAESELPLEENAQLDGVTGVVRKDRGMSHYATLAERVRRAVAVETEWQQ
jgi:CheY-like chemotaxis protein